MRLKSSRLSARARQGCCRGGLRILGRLRRRFIHRLRHHVSPRDIGQIEVFIDLTEELQMALIVIQAVMSDLRMCEVIDILADPPFGEMHIQS